jgi:hypothetical protein
MPLVNYLLRQRTSQPAEHEDVRQHQGVHDECLRNVSVVSPALKRQKFLVKDSKALWSDTIYTFGEIRSVGRDISVGIATRYWLDFPGMGSRWG